MCILLRIDDVAENNLYTRSENVRLESITGLKIFIKLLQVVEEKYIIRSVEGSIWYWA
jgi:hypothetical protein